MSFLEYLLNCSIWHVVIFFLLLFFAAIPIAVAIFFAIRLFFKKDKAFLKLFAICFAVVAFSATFLINERFKGNLRHTQEYGSEKRVEFKRKIDSINEMIAKNPRDANNYFSRGKAYADNLYYNKALQDFSKALALNPKLPMAHNYVCNIYLAKGRYEAAEESCVKAMQGAPNYSKPYFNLARICQNKQDYDGALKYINTAIELDPKFYEAYLLRVDIYDYQREYVKAIKDLKRAMKLNPRGKSYLKKQLTLMRNKRRTLLRSPATVSRGQEIKDSKIEEDEEDIESEDDIDEETQDQADDAENVAQEFQAGVE